MSSVPHSAWLRSKPEVGHHRLRVEALWTGLPRISVAFGLTKYTS